MRLITFSLFLLCFFLTVGCLNKEIQPVINIPELAGQSAAFIDSRLGAPAEVTPTDEPGTTPGEFRDYRIPGVSPKLTSHGVMVRFNKDRAVDFTFELPEPTSSPEEALLMAGINVRPFSQDSVNEIVIRWSGAFNGVMFNAVSAQRLDTSGTYYTLVQAEVYK